MLVDQRDRPMLELARGVALGVNIGNFLELERTFERKRIARAAAKIEDVLAVLQFLREPLDLGLERKRLVQMARHFDEGAHEIALVVWRKRAAYAAGRDREASECGELAGGRLGGG